MPDDETTEDALLEAARAAMGASHAPYSGYRVGAVLEARDGRRYAGCNVENASYPVGICAEHNALGTAVAAGARDFRRLALAVSGEEAATPCGKCRQALAEFGGELEIVSVGAGGERRHWRLADLLPEGFGAGDLAGGGSPTGAGGPDAG